MTIENDYSIPLSTSENNDMDQDRLVTFHTEVMRTVLQNTTPAEIAAAIEAYVDPDDLDDLFEAITNLPSFNKWAHDDPDVSFTSN